MGRRSRTCLGLYWSLATSYHKGLHRDRFLGSYWPSSEAIGCSCFSAHGKTASNSFLVRSSSFDYVIFLNRNYVNNFSIALFSFTVCVRFLRKYMLPDPPRLARLFADQSVNNKL